MKNAQTVGKAVIIQPIPAAMEVVVCGSRLHEYQELRMINKRSEKLFLKALDT